MNPYREVYRRLFTAENPAGIEWEQMPGHMSYVATAEEGIVWALDDEDDIWIWEEGKISVEEVIRNEKVGFTQVAGKLVQVDTGKDGRLVGVNSGGTAFMRTGITKK